MVIVACGHLKKAIFTLVILTNGGYCQLVIEKMVVALASSKHIIILTHTYTALYLLIIILQLIHHAMRTANLVIT